jgi:hypothetical protein
MQFLQHIQCHKFERKNPDAHTCMSVASWIKKALQYATKVIDTLYDHQKLKSGF